MGDDWLNGEEPQLREETRAARGRVVELIVSVALFSTLLNLAVNFASSLLLPLLTPGEQLAAIGGCVALTLLVAALLVPRISTTVKEFHEEIELCLPLLVSPDDVEGLRVAGYDGVTDAVRAALAKRSAEERKQLAGVFTTLSNGGDGKTRKLVTAFALELAQFLLAVEVAQRSRQLLGREAAYHTYREIARVQPSIQLSAWDDLARRAASNPYFQQRTLGVPEKLVLPGKARLSVPDVAAQTQAARISRDRWSTGPGDIALLRIEAGRDTTMEINALADFTEYAIPQPHTPRRGAAARCYLRNARETRLRELAREEERLAGLLSEQGRPLAPAEADGEQTAEAYAQLHARLFGGRQQPRLLRVFVRFDGVFRIRLLSGERRQRGLYAWGVALSRLLSRLDTEVFMNTLREEGQQVPPRSL